MPNIVSIEKLKLIVGEDTFQELVQQLPGRNIYIPKCFDAEYYDKKQRNNLIRADYHAGMEIHELMVKYQLSRSRIYKIIEKR